MLANHFSFLQVQKFMLLLLITAQQIPMSRLAGIWNLQNMDKNKKCEPEKYSSIYVNNVTLVTWKNL